MIRLQGKLYKIALVRWVDIPRKSVAKLGSGKQIDALLRFNGDIDRVTLMSGKRGFYRLAFKVELLRAAGVDDGDVVKFSLAPDKESREPDLPEEMRLAFQSRPHLQKRWLNHTVAIRRQIVRYIMQAKSPEVQARRCWIFIERLEETGKLQGGT
jgi:hypothetical protein